MGKPVNCNKCKSKHERPVGKACKFNNNLSANSTIYDAGDEGTLVDDVHHSSPLANRNESGSVLLRINDMANAMISMQTEIRAFRSELSEVKAAKAPQLQGNTNNHSPVTHIPGLVNGAQLISHSNTQQLTHTDQLRNNPSLQAMVDQRIQALEESALQDFVSQGKSTKQVKSGRERVAGNDSNRRFNILATGACVCGNCKAAYKIR